MTPLLSIEQVADVLGVGRSTVTRMINGGDLPAVLVRSGKRKKLYRVREQALERWITAREREMLKGAKRGAMTADNLNGHAQDV